LLVALAAGLFALPLLEPLARSQGHTVMAALVHASFGAVCHQLPERSFELLGHPLAVCHRCLGLYAGGLVGLLLLPVLPVLRDRLVERPRRALWFSAPLLVDVALPFDTWWSRSGTGLLAAFPVAAIVWMAWDQIFARAASDRLEHEPAAG
jgi:hypothetical protein